MELTPPTSTGLAGQNNLLLSPPPPPPRLLLLMLVLVARCSLLVLVCVSTRTEPCRLGMRIMQMWFAALGAEGEWFNNLLRRIAEGSPSVSALLDTSALKASLGGRLPAVLRISEYRYFFEKQQQHGGGGGAWWRRELVAQSQPISAVQLGAFRDLPLQGQGTAVPRVLLSPLLLVRRCVAAIGPVGFVWLALSIPLLIKGCCWCWRRRRRRRDGISAAATP